MSPAKRPRTGLTLLEMVTVLILIAAVAALVIPLVGTMRDDSAESTTRANMRNLQDVIMNRYWPDMNNVTQMAGADGLPQPHPTDSLRDPTTRVNHPQLRFLFYSPRPDALTAADYRSAGRGWNGPYLQPGATYPDPTNIADSVKDWFDRGYTNTYGEQGDPTVLDGWLNPIVLERVNASLARLVSGGPDGNLSTTEDNVTINLILPQ